MSVSFSCDGCGKPLDEPVKVGHVIIRDYCTECSEKAERFLKAEESLRETLYERFTDDRALLIANFGEKFRLPDVPDA